jgi:hypothetical protein
MRAMAPDVAARYQRAADLLDDILAVRAPSRRRSSGSAPLDPAARIGREDSDRVHQRLRGRDAPAARFCWQCRKPLHARSDRCPFCGEAQ